MAAVKRKKVSGIVVSLADSSAGSVRIVFDDVHRHGQGWRQATHFTRLDLDARALRRRGLSKRQAQQIGEALLFRLLAHAAAERPEGAED